MFLDALNSYSRNQNLTATGNSTNIIDHGGNGRDIGIGEQLYLVVNVKAASGTSPTLAVALQTDDNDSFSSAASLTAKAAVAAVDGLQIVLPIPPGVERYTRVAYTLAGTSPDITLDAHIVHSAQFKKMYPSGWTIL